MFLIISCSPDSDNDIIQPESVSPAQYNSDVVVSWFNLIKVLTTETAGYTPPVAARAFGYTGIAFWLDNIIVTIGRTRNYQKHKNKTA